MMLSRAAGRKRLRPTALITSLTSSTRPSWPYETSRSVYAQMMSGTIPVLLPAWSFVVSWPYGTVSCLTEAPGFAFVKAASHHFSDVSASGRVSGLHVLIVPVAASIRGAADAQPATRPAYPAEARAAPPASPYLSNSRRVTSRARRSEPKSDISSSFWKRYRGQRRRYPLISHEVKQRDGQMDPEAGFDSRRRGC